MIKGFLKKTFSLATSAFTSSMAYTGLKNILPNAIALNNRTTIAGGAAGLAAVGTYERSPCNIIV